MRLVEVEAYAGHDDPGSHAHRGRTDRNASMFAAPGTLYCYLIYGMHVRANVSAGAADDAPGAVLLRAGEVVEGIELARARRTPASGRTPPDHHLARGPGNLCRAMGIGLAHDGADLSRGSVTLAPTAADASERIEQIAQGPRVGLRQAADLPWRWWIAGDPHVSQYRPAAPQTSRGAR